MRSVFFDTNVIIDFLADRKPFSIYAAKLFEYAAKKTILIHVSAVSYNNIYYIMRKSQSHVATIQILFDLNKLVDVIEVNGEVILSSWSSGFVDFEDAIQYNCAKRIMNLDCIVTRDSDGFKKSTLSVMTPLELLSLIESDKLL